MTTQSHNPDPDPLSYYEHELPAVIRGVRNGEKWEWQDKEEPRWHTSADQCLENVLYKLSLGFRVRLAPKPTLRPWTFETRPEGMVWVHEKDNSGEDCLITAWEAEGAYIATTGFVRYEALFTDWLQRDGKPCGTEEGGSK